MTHKLLAGLLCCWYILSVLGFDVHVCGHTGNVFVESLLAFVSSEDNCHAVDCDCCSESYSCSHHDGESEDTDCEDIVERIDLPGTQSSIVEMPAPASVDIHVCRNVESEVSAVSVTAMISSEISDPPIIDVPSLFCVMRV